MKLDGLELILVVEDYRNKGKYIIFKSSYGYDLVFVEWDYTGKPWDYTDPILVNALFNECLSKLFEILFEKAVLENNF